MHHLMHFTSNHLGTPPTFVGTPTGPLDTQHLGRLLPDYVNERALRDSEQISLRATATSRLYHAGVDEQLVMEVTGHCSVEGVLCFYVYVIPPLHSEDTPSLHPEMHGIH